MNIYTVRDNLQNTIAAKKALRKIYEMPAPSTTQFVQETMIHFLDINIDELNKILADVEVCCKQASDASWALDPRQGGI
jgi:hypothetical protein